MNYIGKEAVFMAPRGRQSLSKYNEKIGTIISLSGNRFTLEFPDGKSLTEVPAENLRFVSSTVKENKTMKIKRYLLEDEIKYSKEERKAFLESIKQFQQYRNEVFRSAKLKEISEQIGHLVESAEAFTLKETDQWFDNMTVSRDLKELKNDYKLFEKTCKEITQYQQRLESLYENIGTRLSRYYEM